MKVTNKLIDEKGNYITKKELVNVKQSSQTNSIKVVYAHTGTVNDNGLKLNEDSLEVTRQRYPLLVEHADNRVEDVVGYITTDGKPNDKGEFVGEVVFYTTPQGSHAETLWNDGVYNELSVSYYIKDFEVIDDLENGEYLNVKKALLKEVSIVSVGADRDTYEIIDGDQTEDVEDEPKDVEDEPQDTIEEEVVENADESDNELERVKLNFLKSII